jgi:hypothetical protein
MFNTLNNTLAKCPHCRQVYVASGRLLRTVENVEFQFVGRPTFRPHSCHHLLRAVTRTFARRHRDYGMWRVHTAPISLFYRSGR